MKINTVDIPADWKASGLKSISMSKLQDIVVLAGKNGSGKSRILNAVYQAVQSMPTKGAIEKAKLELETIQQSHSKERDLLESMLSRPKSIASPQHRELLAEQIAIKERNLNSLSAQIRSHSEITNWSMLRFDKHYDAYPAISFVPRSTSLVDPRALGASVLQERAVAVEKAGVSHLAEGALAKIQYVQDRWFNATHPDSKTASVDKALAVTEYNRLEQYLLRFLDTKLGRTSAGPATIFDQPLADSKLSEGQTILLQMCVAMFSQQSSLRGAVLFLDEPETHLHPAVLLAFIEELKSSLPEGQIWIATHSIPLLSALAPSNIWYVKDGKATFAGNSPAEVLEELLGGDDQRAQLRDFIDLPAIHALHRHAFESLFIPQPTTTPVSDPQTAQIREEFRRLKRSDRPLQILDYGAGRGRLPANIAEAGVDTDTISYFAFDAHADHREECLINIHRIHANPQGRYFNDIQSLRASQQSSRFDLVVLANVLHEIDPSEWLCLFSHGGHLAQLMHTHGSVVIVEDHAMPVGEKAYLNGFIVLDTAELRTLFQVHTDDPGFIMRDAKGDGRLKSHTISRHLFTQITGESRTNALRAANKVAQAKILEIRTKETSYLNGKKHGFWVQQLANTQLALVALGSS